YLGDGVWSLLERPDTRPRLDAIAARVQEFGGDATLVSGARLSEPRAVSLVEQFRAARDEEYHEIASEAARLLEHVARETEHRQFTYAELEELEADLGKLHRWTDQVVARDYFGGGPTAVLADALERCERARATVLETG